MPMLRRDLLRRLPALPFAVAGATAALPRVVTGIGNALSSDRYNEISFTSEFGTEAENITIFMEDVAAVKVPAAQLYQAGEAPTMAAMRGVAQWEMYYQRIIKIAEYCNVAIEKAEELVGHPLRILPPG